MATRQFVSIVCLVLSSTYNAWNFTFSGDVVELSLKVIYVGPELVLFGWDEFMPHLMDHRMFLGYQLYRRKVDSENVDIFEGRDACRDR